MGVRGGVFAEAESEDRCKFLCEEEGGGKEGQKGRRRRAGEGQGVRWFGRKKEEVGSGMETGGVCGAEGCVS